MQSLQQLLPSCDVFQRLYPAWGKQKTLQISREDAEGPAFGYGEHSKYRNSVAIVTVTMNCCLAPRSGVKYC